jgi:chemotaxis protein CheX
MITEKELNVFLNGARNYFRTISQQDIDVGTPYLVNNREVEAWDYTGIIGISGARKGCVFVTAPTAMIRHLLAVLGEKGMDPDVIRDAIGEVANTISGNARAEFGPEFMISVPIVVEGRPVLINLPKELMAFVVPVQWSSYSLSVVVCLE